MTIPLNGQPQPNITGALDIDLSFTPATNLMPLRRLATSQATSLHVTAAWLRYPDQQLHPLTQTYDKIGSYELVSYAARQTGFSTQLCVDRSGFITLYPKHWEGEVHHEV